MNLIVYKDKIVAVREYGLSFLTAYGTPENFKIAYFDKRLPKICKTPSPSREISYISTPRAGCITTTAVKPKSRVRRLRRS